MEKVRNNRKLCPNDFCFIHGGTKTQICLSKKCTGKDKNNKRFYNCSVHRTNPTWWPLCPTDGCGKAKHKIYLERRAKRKTLQQNSSITIEHAQTNNSIQDNTVVATPGVATTVLS